MASLSLVIVDDEVGRRHAYMFTIDHVLKSQKVEISKNDFVKVLCDWYPEEDIRDQGEKIVVQRMQFNFKNDIYVEGEIVGNKTQKFTPVKCGEY